MQQSHSGADSAIRAIAQRARHTLNARRIVLFGSRARGDGQPTSDIDLLIDTDASDALWARFCADIADSAPTLLQVDLVRADKIDADLARQIAQEGREIHVP